MKPTDEELDQLATVMPNAARAMREQRDRDRVPAPTTWSYPLPMELAREVGAAAEVEQIDSNALVREAVRQYLDRRAMRMPQGGVR